MNYSEIIYFDFITVGEVNKTLRLHSDIAIEEELHIVELVAKRSSEQGFYRFLPDATLTWSATTLNNPFFSFLQWIDSIKKKGQKVILVLMFFHHHILKKAFMDAGVTVPEYIVFFDSHSLVGKIELIDAIWADWALSLTNYDFPKATKNQNNLDLRIFNGAITCERASRLLGYCGFEDYLNKNMTETWKHLEINEDYEPKVSKNMQKNCGSWMLSYENTAIIHEKWKQAIDFYRGGKLTGITSMKICTMKDENGRSDHLFQCIYFCCDVTKKSDKDQIMEVGKNVIHHMDYSHDSGCIGYDSDTYQLSLHVPKINDPFKKGKLLLQIQSRFLGRFVPQFTNKKFLAKINQDFNSSTHDAIRQLEQWHKDLNEKYEELNKKWNDLSKEYENESTSEERCLELSEEVAFMDVEYMKKEFDPLHHKLHSVIKTTLKILLGEFSFEYISLCTPMDDNKNTFHDIECMKKTNQIGFWCIACTYLQDKCRKCLLDTLSNEASPSPSEQQYQNDKLNKMKKNKEAKKEHAENKVQSVIVKENQEKPYDMEKVLEALGETGTKPKSISNEASAQASPFPSEQQYNKAKLNKMKQRKQAKKERAENKLKSVIVKEDQEKPYDIEKVLEALGETGTKPKSITNTSKSKRKKKSKNHLGKNFNETENTNHDANKESGANHESESNIQGDIEGASSSLLTTSTGEADKSMNSKEENEKIPLEVLTYFENIEQENKKIKTEYIPTVEKLMQKFEVRNKEFEKLEIKNKELEEKNLCKVCMDAEISFVFLPCWHMCTCENCAVNGNLKDCPICRVKIEKRNKIFT